MPAPEQPQPRLEIGGVARAHGIRGEVVIVTHDPDSETLGHVDAIYIGDTRYTISGARDTQRGWLIQLAGITTRNEAETLRGKRVEIDRSDLDLDDEAILLHDIVGCNVVLVDGTPYGVVAAIDSGPGQDRLVIHATRDDGVAIERLVPLVDELVPKIDLDARLVTVDPPEGTPETKL